jgi:hypothetical protein
MKQKNKHEQRHNRLQMKEKTTKQRHITPHQSLKQSNNQSPQPIHGPHKTNNTQCATLNANFTPKDFNSA